MNFGLIQQQTTSLHMTQQLQQAISLLQYSSVELSEFLQEQSLENPLIELETNEKNDPFEKEALHQNQEAHRSDGSSLHAAASSSSPLDFSTKQTVSLSEHLLSQLGLIKIDSSSAEVVRYLIYLLDESGYLREPLSEIANELKRSEAEIIEHLSLLQTFEPTGVGARTLNECLLLQLRRKKEKHPLAELIVSEYLEPFALKKWQQLSKDLNISLVELQDIHDQLRELNPRPGMQFSDELPRYIVPDVTIEIVNQKLQVILHDEYIPKITLNKQYLELLLASKNTEETMYAKKKYEQMKWIIDSIAQRQTTLLQVTEAIAYFQESFLLGKEDGLKPLTLKDIANEINVHQSTVSRVTTNKYVQTPKGLFELKHFFTARATKASDEQTSADAVKKYLETIIEHENKRKPLSDQKIVEKLAERYDVQISRRTIAKYREQLNIPPASQRRRYDG